MIDALLPILLALAVTLGPIAAGIALRRKFSPATDGGTPQTGGQKAARLLGTLLVWAGAIASLLMIVFALHYKGKFL